MTFPVVADTSNGTEGANTTTFSLTYPSNMAAGNLLIARLAIDGSPTLSAWPAGWTRLGGQADATNAVTLEVWMKRASGSESGAFNVTSSASEQNAWQIARITGAHASTDPEIALTQGSSTNPDPPNLDPSNWGPEDTLWLAIGAGDSGSVSNFSAGPSSYTNFSAFSNGLAGGASLGVARRELNASSENPGVFTRSNEQWVTGTVAIRPAAADILINTGIASEASSGLSPSFNKVFTNGLASETSSSLVASINKLFTTGVASETSQSLGSLISKLFTTGIAAESDSTLAPLINKIISTGVSVETSVAIASVTAKAIQTGIAEEIDQALTFVEGIVRILNPGLRGLNETIQSIQQIVETYVAQETGNVTIIQDVQRNTHISDNIPITSIIEE